MIEFDGLEVRYGDHVALPEFDLSIDEAEFFTLLGPSGCGKTTALRTLAGLVEPAAGAIRIGGRDVTRLRGDQRELGMVFQNYALFPSMSVRENIAFGLKVQRRSKREIAEAVAEVAETVDLAEKLLDRTVAELSGGQQQRVAIARSLVLRPKILLLDEPLSNLDAKLRQQLRVQLKELQRHVGITTVYVTHDQEEALTLSDRIAVMNDGRIEQVGTPQEIYDRPSTEFVCRFIGDGDRLDPRLLERIGADPAAPTYIRTEKAGLRPDPSGSAPVSGTVADRAFQGHSSTYTVDLGDAGTIRVLVPEAGVGHSGGMAPVRIGDRVEVVLPREHLLAYPAAGAPAADGTAGQSAAHGDGERA